MDSIPRLDMVMPLDALQPLLTIPSISMIEDSQEDKPVQGQSLGESGTLALPPLIFGAGSLSNQYNDDDHLTGDVPLRTIRLALRYGVRAFDTSAYYGPSEIVLGNALHALSSEFPRSSYKLMTKCGRYGAKKADFDYSPTTIRKSVERSLRRLNTNYLDVVFLHDVEFIATTVAPSPDGNPLSSLGSAAHLYGLAKGQEGKVWGDGDREILGAYAELRKLQEEGVIKQIGITGYPLPTLLRLALLVLLSPPYKPIDILLSYSHSNLQNTAFAEFAPHFLERAQIGQLIAASPLNMGLLTPSPPTWHPAPPDLRDVTARARDACTAWPGGLPNIALGFSMHMGSSSAHPVGKVKVSATVSANGPGGGLANGNLKSKTSEAAFPVVVGFSTPREVHESVKVWRSVQGGLDSVQRKEIEDIVLEMFKDSGYYNWSWASPPVDA